MPRTIRVATVLAASLALFLAVAACGSAPTSTHPPSLTGYWTGSMMDEENPAQPSLVGQTFLTLDQSTTGELTGSATFCGGVYGIHTVTNAVSGTVTTANVQVDIEFYRLSGTYTAGTLPHIALQGTFSSGPQVQKAVAVTLTPTTQAGYESGCPATPTVSA
jgi:hypothetical protein